MKMHALGTVAVVVLLAAGWSPALAVTCVDVGDVAYKGDVRKLKELYKDYDIPIDCTREHVIEKAFLKSYNRQNTIRFLVKKGADVKECYACVSNAVSGLLHTLEAFGDTFRKQANETISILEKYDVNLDTAIEYIIYEHRHIIHEPDTPPIVAENSITLLKIFQLAGADVNARDENGYTPLHMATDPYSGPRTYPHAMIEALLEAGANPNARDDEGMTPLHYAVDADHVGAVTTLLAAGANVNAKNDDGETPLSYSDNAEVAAALKAAGGTE